MVFFLSLLQHKIQGYLIPAAWFPLCRRMHEYHLIIMSSPCNSAEELFSTIMTRLRLSKAPYIISHVDNSNHFCILYKFSNIYQFMSRLSLEVKPTSIDRTPSRRKHTHNAYEIHINSVSTGLFPVWVPLGWLWSSLCCWIPFPDQGVNESYTYELYELIKTQDMVLVSDSPRLVQDRVPVVSMSGSSMFFFSFIVSPILVVALALMFFGSA
jgi:hypothetical protein